MITYRYPNDPNAPKQGNSDTPLDVDDYVFGPLIEEVHWVSGMIGVLTAEFNETSALDVDGIDPPDVFSEFIEVIAGQVLTAEDYKTHQIIRLSVDGILGEETTEVAYTVYLAIGSVASSGYGVGDMTLYDESVAAQTAAIGRGPDMETFGAIFFDIITHIDHPDGTSIDYTSGFEAKTFSLPDFDWTSWANAIWITTTDIPAQVANNVRRNFLVNFTNRPQPTPLPTPPPAPVPYVKTAGVRAFPGGLPHSSSFTLKIYPTGTEFTVEGDGNLTANKPATKTQTGEASNTSEGIIQLFDKSGFVT